MARERTDGIDDKSAAEAERLSRHNMWISGVLVDLGMLPVYHIPQLPKSAREFLPMVNLVFQRLQKAQASGGGPWD
jgi:hypothetical protein